LQNDNFIQSSEMNKSEFESILPLKVQDLIALMIDAQNINFDEAMQWLYNSKLYEALSNEDTKLWHLSTEKLFDLLLTEKNTTELVYPDFV